jgi:flagella basal body P-ring formation protein FlgA
MGRARRIGALGLLLAGAACAAGPGYQDVDSIRRRAADFARTLHAQDHGTIRVDAGRLDARLHFPACPMALQGFLPPGGRSVGNTTIGVRCPSPASPWQLYVPVTVRVMDQVVVAARPLSRGVTLSADDVRLVEYDLATLPSGYLLDLAKAVGAQMRLPVAAGSVLLPSQIEGPRLVRRGDLVNAVARAGGLEVRIQAQALADGAAGDTIKLRNPLTKKEFSGVVTPEGLVQVQM